MTSSEIAHAEESSLDLLPAQRPPAESARRMLVAHAEMMDAAWKLAGPMVNTSMVPARFRGKQEDATAAILYGAELGLNPIQSLQRIIPIHGMPSLEARTMVALLKSRGYKIRTIAQSDESVTVQGIDPDGDVFESTWTIERARKAGYVPEIDERTGKYKVNANGKLIGNEKYITDPQAMLKAKAQAEVCRDMAPDVLMGISYTSEELQSENWDSGATFAEQNQQAPRGRGAAITTADILNDEPVAADPEPDGYDDNLTGEEPRPESESEPGQGGGDDQSQGAEPSSGATLQADSGDQAPAEPEPVGEPAPKKKTAARTAREKRLFSLLRTAQVEDRDDRIAIYRFITGNGAIASTNDLTDREIDQVSDTLHKWEQKKELDERVTDILNSVSLAEAAEAAENTDN